MKNGTRLCFSLQERLMENGTRLFTGKIDEKRHKAVFFLTGKIDEKRHKAVFFFTGGGVYKNNCLCHNLLYLFCLFCFLISFYFI